MRSLSPSQLEEIVAQLRPQDGEILRSVLEQPAYRRARLRRERREAFQAARRVLAPELGITAASEALATALHRYLASAWPQHRYMDEMLSTASEQHRVLHRIARATGGKRLSARTVLDELV